MLNNLAVHDTEIKREITGMQVKKKLTVKSRSRQNVSEMAGRLVLLGTDNI
jgi:hypothetical protein